MRIAIIAAIAVVAAAAQTRPAFEVATIKPSAPLDVAKMMAAVQAGQTPKMGPQIGPERAEYIYMSLRDLIGEAYNVKPYQVTGPDWLAGQRFDIVAKIPEGSKKEDAPKMLQSLLEDRFYLALRHSTAEHPVLAIVVGKNGPKLKESGAPAPMDGPSRITLNKGGGGTVNMGSKGIVNFRTDPATQIMHMEATMITMAGVAEMLTQFSQMMGGGTGLQFADMTGLTSHYQIALDFSQSDRATMIHSMGLDTSGASPADPDSDPAGNSLLTAVQALGLKLERRKATVEQLIVDHVEKAPAEN